MGLRQPPVTAPQSLPQYDLLRKKASQQAEADQQNSSDALQRRYAAMGALNSGSYLKQQQITDDDALKRRDAAVEGVNAQEQSELQRRQDVTDQNKFASGEAEKGRTFQSGEAEKQRGFQKGLSDQDFDLKNRAFDVEKTTKLGSLDLAKREFDRDSAITKFNQAIAVGQSGTPAEIQAILQQIESGQYGDLGELSPGFGKQTQAQASAPQFRQDFLNSDRGKTLANGVAYLLNGPLRHNNTEVENYVLQYGGTRADAQELMRRVGGG